MPQLVLFRNGHVQTCLSGAIKVSIDPFPLTLVIVIHLHIHTRSGCYVRLNAIPFATARAHTGQSASTQPISKNFQSSGCDKTHNITQVYNEKVSFSVIC